MARSAEWPEGRLESESSFQWPPVVRSEVPPVLSTPENGPGQGSREGRFSAGFNADTPNPVVGVIRREADGKTPNGVLEKAIHYAVLMKVMPAKGEVELDGIDQAGMQLYVANGDTRAQEGRAVAPVDKSWMRLAGNGRMLIDVVSYPDIAANDQPFGLDAPWYSRELKNVNRLARGKISLDGSPQGKTTLLKSQPCVAPPLISVRCRWCWLVGRSVTCQPPQSWLPVRIVTFAEAIPAGVERPLFGSKPPVTAALSWLPV